MDKDSNAAEYSVEVVQRQIMPAYIYRLPDNQDVCYHFATKALTKQQLKSRSKTSSQISHFRVTCIGCLTVQSQMKKQKQPNNYPNTLKVENCSMQSDPALGHLDGCKPVLYKETMKIYSKVTGEDEKNPKPYAFPLEKGVRTDKYGLIYRSREDPNKCLRFFFLVKKNGCFTVLCSHCRKSKGLFHAYKVNENGFMEDPRLHHRTDCRPENLSEKYVTLDNDAATRIISSMIVKDGDIITEKNDQNQTANGFGVVEAKRPVKYLYRIPDTDACFMFNVNRYTKNSVPLNCKICDRNYQTTKRNDDKNCNPPKIRTSDGLSMKDNPLLEHRTDCKPLKYSQVIKEHKVVEDENTSVGEYEYKLVKLRELGGLQVIHKLGNEPTKCYIFDHFNRTKSGCLGVYCTKCQTISQHSREQKRKNGDFAPISAFRHRVAESGFLDDPCNRHLPNCIPYCYETMMKKRQYVDEATARSFFNGKYVHSVITDEEDEIETDFPVLVVQKKNAVSFVYSVGSIAYLFHQLNHGDNSRLFCVTCLSPGDVGPNADVPIRISDGFSMETDPMMHHLEHCRPQTKHAAWKGRNVLREDGSANADRKYKFPLRKRTIMENYSAIYRLVDDPAHCYLFKSVSYVLKSRYLRVRCTGCRVAEKNSRQISKETYVPSYRLTSSGFLDDPALHHIPGCEKHRFDDIMRENAVTVGQEACDYFKHIDSSAKTHGILVPSGSKAKHNSPEICEDMNKCLKQEITESNNQLMNEVQEEPSEQCQRTAVETELKDFSKVFEIPFFTENEVSVTLIGQIVTVKCEREVSAKGVAGCSLSYWIELPSSVDISTVETIWSDARITITAQTTF